MSSLANLLVFSGQSLEKLDDPGLVCGGSRAPELVAEHHVYRVLERLRRAVVEIRSGELDVAQARHLEHVAVRFPFGDGVASQVGVGGLAAILEIVAEHAEGLEHIAAYVDALMARDAAVALEELIAAFFVAVDR